MRFEWDEVKNAANIAKHGVSFLQAAEIYDGIVYNVGEDLLDDGELRCLDLGMTGGLLVLVVASTERGERTRIISARRAERRERRLFDEYCKTIGRRF